MKMDFEKLKAEINKHTWWSEVCPTIVQTVYKPLECFLRQSNIIHPKLLSIGIFGYKDSLLFERTPEDEKYEVFEFIYQEMLKDESYLDQKMSLTREREEKLNVFLKDFFQNVDNYSKQELSKKYQEFMELYLSFLELGGAIECVDIATNYHLERKIKEAIPEVTTEDLKKIIFSFTTPSHLSFIEEEHLEFLKIIIDNFDNLDENLFLEHAKKYYYVLTNFREFEVLDKSHFLKKAEELVSKKNLEELKKESWQIKNKLSRIENEKEQLQNKFSFSKELLTYLLSIRKLGEAVDQRKNRMLQGNHDISLICKVISEKTSVSLEEIYDYNYEQTIELLEKDKVLSAEELENNRNAIYVVLRKEDGFLDRQWFYSEEAEELLKLTDSHSVDGELRGQVASNPVDKLEGEVKIIMHVSKEVFEEGEILVTSMTRPEFVPLMRKASAIITDEGGITSHAAIVSRELKIPCIIGTKKATSLLKNGDKVIMNLKTGVITKV